MSRCQPNMQTPASPLYRLNRHGIIASAFSHHHLLPGTYNNSWKRPRRATRNPHHFKSIQNGAFNTLHHLCRWPLTKRSFQDALRTFFQPIKTDDPRLDFYTMYKREATEYDTEYVKRYDEDLNTTLIFVCYTPSVLQIISSVLVGESVLCRQLRFRHRRRLQPPTRSQPGIRCPPPRYPPHSQPVRHPR